MPFGLKFDSSAFAKTLIGRKASRRISTMFAGIGKDNLVYLIQNDKDFLDYIPSDQLYQYRSSSQAYKDYAEFFSDDDIYKWIPDPWKSIIEAQPTGREWVYRQLQFIRDKFFA